MVPSQRQKNNEKNLGDKYQKSYQAKISPVSHLWGNLHSCMQKGQKKKNHQAFTERT